MGAGAIESGGTGGTYNTEDYTKTTSFPNVPEANATQLGEQQGYTQDYTDIVNQALGLYQAPTSTTTVTPGTPSSGLDPTQSYEQYLAWHNKFYGGLNYDGTPVHSVYAQPQWQRMKDQEDFGTNSDRWNRYVGTGVATPDITTTVNSGSYAGDALQQALNALGGLSAGNTLPSYLGGPGSAAGGDVFQGQNYQPYINVGSAAAQEAGNLAGLGPNAYNSQEIYDRYLSNPAVQAQMQQGNNAVNSNFGAKGLTGSSAVLKALQEFGQNQAFSTIGEAQKNLYNLAGLGAQSASQYAANLLSNYNTNINAQLQNQNLAQQAATSRGQLSNQALQNQSALLAALGQGTNTTNTQASLQRQSSLANALQQEQGHKVSISAPILETNAQTMMGVGAQGAGSLIGTGIMALLGL